MLKATRAQGHPRSRRHPRSRPPALMSKKAEAGGAEEARQRGQERRCRWLAMLCVVVMPLPMGVLCSAAGSVSLLRQERWGFAVALFVHCSSLSFVHCSSCVCVHCAGHIWTYMGPITIFVMLCANFGKFQL